MLFSQGGPLQPSAGQLARYFLYLGVSGFGGPIALVAQMERDLVERRGWFTPAEFSKGMALSQLAPGPLAAQLAMYLGWLRGGVRGATLTGLAFVAPSFAIVMVLSAAYVAAGAMPWLRAAFFGVGAVIIAIIARAALRLARRTLAADRLAWIVAIGNAGVVALTGRELLTAFVVSGLVVMLARTSLPKWSGGVIGAFGALTLPPLPPLPPLPSLFLFFVKSGSIVFGSGLAIIPFLYDGVVLQQAWLTDQQFLDAVAVAMLTPGPVVITVAFIGYLIAGPLGGTLAAIGVFAPVWLVTIVCAPYFDRLARMPRLKAFVDGVTAAATGGLAGAVVVLGQRAITDWRAAMFALAALLALRVWKRLPEPALIAAAGVAGILLG